jgi:hypothetical protein
MNEQEHTPVDEQLEARLAGLSEWRGATGEPLRRAWAATERQDPVVGVVGRVAERIRGVRVTPRRAAAAVLVACAGLVVAASLVPTPRSRTGVLPSMSERSAKYSVSNGQSDIRAQGFNPSSPPPNAFAGEESLKVASGMSVLGESTVVGITSGSLPLTERLTTAAKPSPTRQIIRRAQMDMVVADVALAFRAVQDLIKPELGEYVQDTTLSGSGSAVIGRVIMRVAPDRFADAMRAVRTLGELASEQTGGDDVTDRLSDLDAQIRTERRVEQEMLELFDLRKDAPLKEVLELREQLARVRGTIERLEAQKAQTTRLVALATLTVTVRPRADEAVAPPPVDETPSFGARVSGEVSRSWDRATNNLASWAGWTVEVAIGRLPLWITLATLGIVAWRAVRGRKGQDGAAKG